MDIWTIAIIGGIAFLVLSFLSSKIPSFDMPKIPFLSDNNSTEEPESNPLPEEVQKGIDTLEKSYTLPLWLLVLICIGLIWIAKR